MCDTVHWLAIQQRIFYRICALIWRCLPWIVSVYLQDLCRPVLSLVGRPAPCSGGDLLFSRLNISNKKHHAFSAVVPSILNSLFLEIRLLTQHNTPFLYKLLKADLNRRVDLGAPVSRLLDGRSIHYPKLEWINSAPCRRHLVRIRSFAIAWVLRRLKLTHCLLFCLIWFSGDH